MGNKNMLHFFNKTAFQQLLSYHKVKTLMLIQLNPMNLIRQQVNLPSASD